MRVGEDSDFHELESCMHSPRWLSTHYDKREWNNYSGPEGARVKVPPLFFVIIIFCVFVF